MEKYTVFIRYGVLWIKSCVKKWATKQDRPLLAHFLQKSLLKVRLTCTKRYWKVDEEKILMNRGCKIL